MAACEKCDDREVIEKDGKLFECICSFLKRISASMPPEIRKAEVKSAHLKHPLMKLMGANVFIISTRRDMMAIIKALILKNPKKYIRVTSDAEIRDVFVGSMSRASRTSDYQGEVLNNLADLMLPPNLVLVRLNELAYKNKAASGALEEALKYRYNRDRPTWILSDVDHKFQKGSHAYSDSVWELMSMGYSHVKIPRILEPPTLVHSIEIDVQDNPDIRAPNLNAGLAPITPDPISMEFDLDDGNGGFVGDDEEPVNEEDDDGASGALKGWGQGLGESKSKWRKRR